MRKASAITFAVLMLGAICGAQIPGSGNAFFGYSFAQGEIPTKAGAAAINMQGWEASVDGKVMPWLSAVADLDWHYGSATSTCSTANCTPAPIDGSRHMLLFGARPFIQKGKFTPYAQALLGFAHQTTATGAQASAQWAFASAAGGGIGYALRKGIAWRTQLDWIHSQLFGGHNEIRVSTGLAFHF